MSYRRLGFEFRMGASTIGAIVSETSDVLWEKLQPLHMPVPTRESFRSIADDFSKIWNFPNCIGALDGKHVRIRCLKLSGSMFYNYKQYFSVVLQALVDANYRLIAIDVGGYGKQSDGGTFQASNLYRAILGGKIQIPAPRTLPETNVVAPFVFLADEAYPLMDFLLKPYGRGNLSLEEECFRSRKTVECAFGILVSKWGILDKPIKADTELVDRRVKCVCILHNAIIDKDGMDHNYTETEQTRSDSSVMWNRCNRPSNDTKTTRDIFTAYFSQQPLEYRES
ncbi:protein antagonist of like heterochromatin protein 1 [Plakobranchus ocellatus]|uniref:Protein antagonist of like heterochromatin protein 1 n=1 Tax=Plakobranchus ocellatus TaxID=259542 RepID=A0AAV3ZIH1_9GAST|nr:protein antagonist of like heterochromatin protein 1 [Plakobranchus ocellatus]